MGERPDLWHRGVLGAIRRWELRWGARHEPRRQGFLRSRVTLVVMVVVVIAGGLNVVGAFAIGQPISALAGACAAYSGLTVLFLRRQARRSTGSATPPGSPAHDRQAL